MHLNLVYSVTVFVAIHTLQCYAEYHLPVCLRSASQIIHYQAQSKGIRFVYKAVSPMPDLILGEERLLRQVLLNLLGKAVKATDQSEVVL